MSNDTATPTGTITEFILARLDEDEATARRASPGGWFYGTVESVAGGALYDETRAIASVNYEQPDEHDGRIVRHLLSAEADQNGAHIARHDPARVLAQCEAMRQIVARHIGCDDVSYGDQSSCPEVAALAAIWSEHPDYDEAWRA